MIPAAMPAPTFNAAFVGAAPPELVDDEAAEAADAGGAPDFGAPVGSKAIAVATEKPCLEAILASAVNTLKRKFCAGVGSAAMTEVPTVLPA